MDRRSWPWKKKSSDKADKVSVANDAAADAALPSTGSKENYKRPNYVKISVESYTHLTGLEDQVKTYEEQVQSLEGQIQELDEKLSEAHSEMTTKENLVKQHAKVAEEAVSGWEKAEAEALALKNHLETLTLSKLTAEDRALHLDGALKECMRQIRNLKEEHEQKLQEVVLIKTKQWDKIRLELEAKIGNLDQELLKAAAENTAISRSFQECSNMLIKISEEKSQAEAEIELLKSNVESCEREISSLKYELHVISKELEIRNEEKNMSMRSAEVANKHHMEGVKKVAKLEAECQRLRGLVRKKLPGPAALAQMKLEVENLGRDYGETRNKRSPIKPSSPHLSPVTEFSLDKLQKYQKENEFLAEHLLAMEEETKMLKEALAQRNGELQASRNLCTKTASKLQSMEAQLQISNQQKNSLSHNASPPSLTSMSEAGNDDERSCADSWATAMISELSQFKKEKNNEKSNRAENGKHLELMDDFLEMEKLACLSNDSNANGAITISGSSNNKIPESVNHASGDPSKDSQLKQHLDLDPSVDHVSSDKDLSVATSGNYADELLATKLQSRISMVFESMSRETVWGKVVEDLKRIVHEAEDSKFQPPVNCVSEEVHCSDAVGRDSELTAEKDISSSQASNVATETLHKPSQDLMNAISQINDFILFLGKEAMIVHGMSSDNNELSQKIAEFSVTFHKISCGGILLDDFIFDLSHVLAKASELRFNIQGFKNSDAEPNSPDCIDKVALPENKMVKKERSGEMYQNGHALVSCSTSDPEVPDDGNLVSSYESNATSCKFSLEEFEELRSEKDSMAADLVRCTENLEMTKSELHKTEQLLAEVKLELAAAQRSNSLAETQLKCMAESYRSLEARAEELETEVNLLRTKTETLENELRDEKRSCQDAMERCNELQEQLQRNGSCSVCSSATDNDVKTKQDRELAAAAEKLAECQETIFLLGKQLKTLRPQKELMVSPYNESSQRGEGFNEEKPSSSGMKLQEFDQAEMDTPASANLQRVGAESPVSSRNQSDTEVDLVRSPISPKYPKHRSTNSTSSSSSTPTPEKQSRGLSRFFSSKGKNGQ
ncbi:filament-like plant protein 4 isoform X2 [Tripterygium wilfordii]|uniref:filament-like plant protein 4 isoform X2 n=1 Tax=Tripterygium wilfordii TaxID=458696 RepID=UPI0018F7FA35|nr:filament-like plant protein 4 isoform X2 [Tripterygium wilfordii]